MSPEVQRQKVSDKLEVVYFGVSFLFTGELQVNVKGGVSMEDMVWGGLMEQVGSERDALSIDYHTEHPCALAGPRLCRRTKP